MPEVGGRTARDRTLRIGVVVYLNAKPLVWRLADMLPAARIVTDLPSRLADGLAAGQLDVALVPSIVTLQRRDYSIVSDACVACDGPVRSVKLVGRCPAHRIRTLALDEGSRTSAVLARLVLSERYGVEPQLCRLPIGESVEAFSADAAVVIGDRAMHLDGGRFHFVWDLGHVWREWTGLPFVFAVWTARPGVARDGLAEAFATARDQGVARVEEIARHEAPRLGLTYADCVDYLRRNLRFRLGPREREGLRRFGQLAARGGLLRSGSDGHDDRPVA